MTITLRSEKGLPLTYTELDENFNDLDTRLTDIEDGTAISVNGLTGDVQLSTTEIPEGTNLYYTNARVDARLGNVSTSILPEGTNLYYTDARVRNAISAGTGLSFNTSTGEMALDTSTTNVSEGTNLYYTNARVDTRLAATSVKALSDVEWAGTPTTNYVLTWTGSVWEPLAAPGASGGEANEGVNLGAGQGLFAGKAGVDLRFYSVAGSNGVTVAAPVSNVITFSLGSSVTLDTITTASNANLQLTPNGTGIVIANTMTVSDLTATRITYAGTDGRLVDHANLTFNGTAISIPQVNLTIADGTAPFVVTSTTRVANLNVANAAYADSAGTATTATSATTAGSATTAASATLAGTVLAASQPNITSVGNLTIANIDNIQINGNTISSTDTNGNVYITPSGSGEVIAASLTVSDLTSGRVVLSDTGGSIIDSANLLFSGTTLTVTGTANISSTINVGNLQFTNGTIAGTATNGNITITPNGTGRVGIGTASPATLLDANGTITSTGLTVNGNVTLGASSASTITLTGRFGSSLVPTTSASYDLGSAANKFRALYASGNVELAGQVVSTITTGTAPFVVTSTTQVANLNVATAGSATTATTAGTVTTAAQPNITSFGNVTTANIGTISSSATNGNVTLSPNGTGSIAVTANILPNANATYNLGSTSLRFNNIWGISSSALYADLAEKYESDHQYENGTVVVLGGEKEITTSNTSHDTRVLGVISTAPAFLMNDAHQLGIWQPVALTGRVPCKVKGPVWQGNLVVTSSIPGVAERLDKQLYEPGCVIGKCVEDHLTDEVKVIEVVIGRF